ncbi:hypothetical protein [Nocardia sp. NPDC047038]|uniref:hypothetical protein n=1 Tax=Nocardia sp. NPDC047038 TaxID=3154338 RepID=UPI00340220C3
MPLAISTMCSRWKRIAAAVESPLSGNSISLNPVVTATLSCPPLWLRNMRLKPGSCGVLSLVDEHFQARVAGANVGIARGVEQCHQVAGGLLVVTARDVARDPMPLRRDPARERGLVQSERARIVMADDEGGLGRTARRCVGGLVIAEQLVCTGQQILLLRTEDVVGSPVAAHSSAAVATRHSISSVVNPVLIGYMGGPFLLCCGDIRARPPHQR